MPTLHWIGKEAVINHDRDVPFRLLRQDAALSAGDPASGNILVEGDNLEALKALLPYYAGRVKCIYIDPPYNTGSENWAYNDNVNSPEMRGWLGRVVGAEKEDLTRHDKWLCMMYPRLRLLRDFLRPEGVIFVSIDEAEAGHLRLLMDEVFHPQNALGTFVWKRRSSSAMRGMPLSVDHEYVLAYGRSAADAKLYGLAKTIEDYPLVDDEGHYVSTDLTVGMTRDERPNQYYPITNPRTGRVYWPSPERVWRFHPDTMQQVMRAGLIIWPDDAGGRMERPRYKTRYDPDTDKPKPVSSWIETAGTNDRDIADDEVEYDTTILTSGMNQAGGRLLQQIFGARAFAYPKPLSLVRSLVRSTTRGDDIVLDTFAGTGTTGHAVLDLNNEDGGRRSFILVEMESSICRSVTAERLRRVINGYTVTKPGGRTAHVPALGGGFRFLTLGSALFTAAAEISPDVSYEDLARHVFYTATGQPLPSEGSLRPPLIGVANGIAVYLLHNGILAGGSASGSDALTDEVLAKLPPHSGPKVIYGSARCVSLDRLQREGIRFCQLPYDVRAQ